MEGTGVERARLVAEWLVSQRHLEREPPPAEFSASGEGDEPIELKAEAPSPPPAVDEDANVPREVPLHKLRIEGLRLECEWKACRYVTSDYDAYQKHVRSHVPQLQVLQGDDPQYACLWDICGFQSADGQEMIRHMNFHAYHMKLMSVGLNARVTLSLHRCKKDSTKRNQLPSQAADYDCLWVGCGESFDAIQQFYDHLKLHVYYSEGRCSWAGCGAKCGRDVGRHLVSHSGEKLIACAHCGRHFVNNTKLRDHLQRQNVPASGGHVCSVCGVACATPRLLRMHARQHVSVYACTFCDMSSPTRSALTAHIRYRHLGSNPDHRPFKCHLCSYSAITKSDLKKHIPTHNRMKRELKGLKENSNSNEEDTETAVKKKRGPRKYYCHMCPKGEDRIFSRGTRLTNHLVKDHGIQWPYGHCRFRYQVCDDGMYRLTTTRYESLEVSRQIMKGSCGIQEPDIQDIKINIKNKSPATRLRPTQLAVKFDGQEDSDDVDEPDEIVNAENVKAEDQENEPSSPNSDQGIEITVCDLDDAGNVVKTEILDPENVVITSKLYKT